MFGLNIKVLYFCSNSTSQIKIEDEKKINEINKTNNCELEKKCDNNRCG